MNASDVLDCLRDIATDTSAFDVTARTAELSGVVYDSRRVIAGSVFVALRGLKADGTEFVPQAVERGAAAIVSEVARPEGLTVPWLIVSDARLALALLADRFYDHPSRQMPVVGVTGTNGKTTTGYLLASMLDAAGM